MGIFYLGILGRKDLLDAIETGDTISVASDQTTGVIYDLEKPIEIIKANLEGMQSVKYKDALAMKMPIDEEVDDRLFIDSEGELGVLFYDYNQKGGVPTEVYYRLIHINDRRIIGTGEYHAMKETTVFSSFQKLLDNLLQKARQRSASLSYRDRQ